MKNYIIPGSLGLLIAVLCFACRTPDHDAGMQSPLTIDTLKYGDFVEWIPQNGTIERDSLGGMKVIVPIDELYLPKISEGLKATTSFNSQEFQLKITYIYPEIHNGIFHVAMSFNGAAPEISTDQKLRLRILLSEPSNELLLPLGDFYTATRGNWIFVVQDNRAIKREIKVGRKSFDYFEVKEGLKKGDRVITSSYELFKDRDSIDVSEILNLLK